MNWKQVIFFILMLVHPSTALFGVEPDEILANPILEKRAREISLELRCLVCRNENIDSSDATLARDLRLLVRERLTLGESNQEVLNFVHARYGDFVLLRPKFSGSSMILWLIAPFSFLLGIFLIYLTLFKKQQIQAKQKFIKSLSESEKKEINRLLKD